MYVAIKWLVFLALTMWITLCCIDFYLWRNHEIGSTEPSLGTALYNNKTVLIEKHEVHEDNSNFHGVSTSMNIINYFTFFAGALIVTAYYRIKDVFTFVKSYIERINIAISICLKTQLNETVIAFRVAIFKCLLLIWKILKKIAIIIINRLQKLPYILRYRQSQNRQNLNLLLLKKMKEVGEQRNSLGQLLLTAISENKNIRLHYQLETLAKNRLIRDIEATQKQIKENRSRYVSFQQLYIVAHQENNFLKARVTKLNKDKEEAERNLMKLVNKVYHSKNTELKAYCSRFIVKSKDNLLNSDVRAEIQQFLLKSEKPATSTSNWPIKEPVNIGINVTKSWPSTRVTDILPYQTLVPAGANAPKLRGLPGEYVWTVKDKDGIIEKLYEYDFGYNFDNGDTIRRIRQYSVYHDKDCFLDNANSKTFVREASVDSESLNQCSAMEFPSDQKFLTGSEAFRRFLLFNENNIVTTPSPAPLLCS